MGISAGVENRQSMESLFEYLARTFTIPLFVETGTFRGQTTRWAGAHFDTVITIEGSETLFRSASADLSGLPNVTCLCGDSRKHLCEVVPGLSGEVLFWLDAHWCGSTTYGKQAECPLIAELEAIYSGDLEPFVLIDDARFFVSIPPAPHDVSHWPGYLEIAEFVRQRCPNAFLTVHEDAIVIVPPWAKEALIEYVRNAHATHRRRTAFSKVATAATAIKRAFGSRRAA
jgi:hypothetical protein